MAGNEFSKVLVSVADARSGEFQPLSEATLAILSQLLEQKRLPGR